MSRRIRRQLLRALPPPLSDDIDLVPLSPASSPSTSPSPAITSTIERYISRVLMSSFILFNLFGVRAMLTPVVMFMLCNMLFDHASIQYMLNLVFQIVMIYILVLIWKLLNYLTIQKPYYRPFLELSMASFIDALRLEKFSGAHFKRWSVKVTDWLSAMKVFWVKDGLREISLMKI